MPKTGNPTQDFSYLDTTVVVEINDNEIKMSCGHLIELTVRLRETFGVNNKMPPGTRVACMQCRDLIVLKERIAELEDHIGLHIEMAEGRRR